MMESTKTQTTGQEQNADPLGSSVATGYNSLLCACTAQNLSPLQAHIDNFGRPVTIGNAARSLGVKLRELTIEEANKISMSTIPTTTYIRQT